MLPWKPHTSQVASYLSARRPSIRYVSVSTSVAKYKYYAATPSTNLTTSLGRRISY